GRLMLQRSDACRKGLDAKRGEKACRFRGSSKSAKKLEGTERTEQLRLVVTIFVLATRRRQGYSSTLFRLESSAGLLGVGVRLERQRRFGRENLEEEWEGRAEFRYHRCAELVFGSIRDHLEQRLPMPSALYPRGGARMRAQPQLGLRTR